MKIQGIQKLLKHLGVKLKCLEVLEKYKTWPKILLLHLVAFKNISKAYCFIVLKVLLGALI
jgi:hypothetical protein